MNNNVSISVIVPVYNCEKYLEKCINSILSQSFEDFELILINDGSTDSSLEICKKYSYLDNRIVLINQKNMGVSNTRKKGITLAKGNYICFIDSDDYIDKDSLKILFKNINESSVDIVCCNSINFGKNAKGPINIKYDEIIKDKERIYNDYFLNFRYTCTLWGKLFNKKILDNLVFPNMRYAEDTFLMLKIFDRIKNIKLIKYCGYNYRIQPQSASNILDEYIKLTDILKRDKLACDICEKFNEQLKQKAFYNFSNDLYALVVLYSKKNEEKELQKICNKINMYYNYIEKYCKQKNIKLQIVKLFLNHKLFVKIMLKIIYIFKKKK